MTFDHRVMRITTVLSVSLAVAAPSLLVLAVMLDNLPVPVAAIVVMGVIVLVLPGALFSILVRQSELRGFIIDIHGCISSWHKFISQPAVGRHLRPGCLSFDADPIRSGAI